ncbi:hypothetical protein [Phaeospirillum tilakii]|uniref:Holin-X, holin superfamily III n=1 Tax=Phaeospirillum tilakii TaxID=741673 RepID=A0ABW5CDM1_9PROT
MMAGSLGSSASSDLASFEEALESAEQDQPIATVDDRIKLSRASAEDKIRSRVTQWVVAVFLIQVSCATIVAVCLPGAVASVEKIIGMAMPVVTLVLGYYFGSASR